MEGGLTCNKWDFGDWISPQTHFAPLALSPSLFLLLYTETSWVLYQGSKGIRQWQINWCKSPMMIRKITGWNVWTLNIMNQPIKIRQIPQRIRKLYYETLETSIINSQLSPPSGYREGGGGGIGSSPICTIKDNILGLSYYCPIPKIPGSISIQN